MKRLSLSRWLSCSLLLAGTTAMLTFEVSAASQPAKLDFNRDIRPILSDNCFACHGPDAKALKGGLRIDLRDSVTKPAKSDKVAVVPGHPETSELIKRITTTDEDDHMPPAKSGKKLAAGQVELLRRWIKEGAEYHQHWAYVPPKQVEPPAVKNSKWPRNGIDNFILARLEQEKIKPAPEADRPALIRRVTLDLTGLPPTPAEVEAFVKDTSPKAYENVVDRLLASPRFGERMTLDWLDAARYGDTHGYHIDSAREMTRWRDGVIKAFNENQPFDQFTIEQLAGDLLPNPTLDQKIASGFNRNHMINFEGGAVADEYHTAYIKDRVNTTSTVWLGLTLTCAECHDHKYDPLTAKDYYSMYAFFNTVPENGLDGSGGNAVPMLQLPSPEQKAKLDDLKELVVSREAALKSADQEVASAQTKWEASIVAAPAESWEPAGLQLRFPLNESLEGIDASGNKVEATLAHPDGPKWSDGRLGKGIKLDGTEKSFVSSTTTLNFDEKTPFSYGVWVKHSGREGALIAKMDESKQLRGFDLLMTDGKIWVHLINAWPENAIRVVTKESVPRDRWAHVFATYDGSGKASGITIYLNGKAAGIEVKEDKLSGTILNDTSLNLGKRSASYAFKGSLEDARFYNRQLTADEVGRLAEAPFVALARTESDKRTDDQKNDLRNYYRRRYSPEWMKADEAVSVARKERDEYNRKIPTTMIMGEMEKPRDTFVLVRGQYDKKGEKVMPATPVALPAMREGEAHNRLGLARWLVSPEQPLTARVTVNRYWQMYFGNGIVKSAENFGSQGDWPTHPELLDWLANQFTRSGWDVKGMQKLILMSATYRQSSAAPRKLVERDPENLLHARGPRIRLQAEFLRDQALAVSGLLNPKIGGETVFPYQPPGLWEELMVREDGDRFSAQKYVQSHGDALYRRSMYMFWKRTSPPASMSALDAPDRQTCVVRRQRTNTPLQALILMNDPTYVEAARKLAERMMTEVKSDRERVTLAYKLALARAPKSSEMDTLLKLYREQLAVYRKNPEAAAKLLKVGEAEPNATLDANELAAWAMVASTILNLDETVTKG